MKKITKYAIYIVLIYFSSSCKKIAVDETDDDSISRIIIKESTLVHYNYMYIIEVDNQEFIVNSQGGIAPLIKKK